MTSTEGWSKRILYGRRRGKALRKNQQELVDTLLADLTVDIDHEINLQDTFGGAKEAYWLEIGFGAGEHLAWQAEHHPNVGIIGCEPFINGVAALLAKVDKAGSKNVRIHNEAAELLLEKLPEGSIDRGFLLFADPWPKTSHKKRRFVSQENISALARVLKKGAELRIGTDHTDYGAWILHHFLASDEFTWNAETPQDWLVRSDDWPQTRYEAKALKEGRKSVYYRFIRN